MISRTQLIESFWGHFVIYVRLRGLTGPRSKWCSINVGSTDVCGRKSLFGVELCGCRELVENMFSPYMTGNASW